MVASRKFAGNGLERRVEAEGHVPDLSGEDEDDGTEFQAKLAGGKQGDHGEHDAGQKAEHRDGLEDVQNGDHEGFGALVVGGDVAVGEGESQAEHVSHRHAHQRVEGVNGQGAAASAG